MILHTELNKKEWAKRDARALSYYSIWLHNVSFQMRLLRPKGEGGNENPIVLN